jgi:hypothetical protein
MPSGLSGSGAAAMSGCRGGQSLLLLLLLLLLLWRVQQSAAVLSQCRPRGRCKCQGAERLADGLLTPAAVQGTGAKLGEECCPRVLLAHVPTEAPQVLRAAAA